MEGESDFQITVGGPGPAGRLTVEVAGDLDLATAPRLEEVLDAVRHEPHHALVLDLRGVEFIDSSGLRSILVAREREIGAGRAVSIIRSRSTIVDRMLEVAEVGDLFEPDPPDGQGRPTP